MNKIRQVAIKSVALLGACSMSLASCTANFDPNNQLQINTDTSNIKQTDYSVNTKLENYYNSDVVFKLPDTVSKNDDISVIVSLNADSIMDTYTARGKTNSLSQFVQSHEGKVVAKQAKTEQKKWLKRLDKLNVPYTLGASYDTILNGFEITIKAKNFK